MGGVFKDSGDPGSILMFLLPGGDVLVDLVFPSIVGSRKGAKKRRSQKQPKRKNTSSQTAWEREARAERQRKEKGQQRENKQAIPRPAKRKKTRKRFATSRKNRPGGRRSQPYTGKEQDEGGVCLDELEAAQHTLEKTPKRPGVTQWEQLTVSRRCSTLKCRRM